MAMGMDNTADIRGMIADAAKEFLGGGQQQQAGAMGQQTMAGAGGLLGQQGGVGVVRSTSPMAGPGLLRHTGGQGNGMQTWATQQLAAAEQQRVQAESLRLLQEQQQQHQAKAMER